jgi:hypothetical protein
MSDDAPSLLVWRGRDRRLVEEDIAAVNAALSVDVRVMHAKAVYVEK